MCRSLIEGGRRCPGGHSTTRAAQSARQRLCRARKALAMAQAAGDQDALAAARGRVSDAEQAIVSLTLTTRPDRSAGRLARAVATQKVIATRRLGGSSAQTDLLELADGTKVVRKQARRFNADGHDPEAEEAASLVARALGLPAPAVHRDGDSLYMEYVDNAATPDDAGAWGGDLPARFAGVPGSDQGKRVGLLDVLTHNTDRSTGNWMLDEDDRLIPIDHGASYGAHITEDQQPSMTYLQGSSPFVDHFGDVNPLTKADIAEVRDRLTRLRPEFERLGRDHWLDYSLRALDELAGKASGTRNLIAAASDGPVEERRVVRPESPVGT